MVIPLQAHGGGVRQTSVFMPEDTMKNVAAGGWAVQPGEFKLGSKIAAGAMGQVMKATLRGTVCAAKMLKQGEGDEQAYKDLITELEILTSVGSHPNLVGFLGAGIADKKEPIVFEEYVDGPSLEKYLTQRALKGSRLEHHTIFGWSLHLLYALEFLHASDPIIMHRGMMFASKNAVVLSGNHMPIFCVHALRLRRSPITVTALFLSQT